MSGLELYAGLAPGLQIILTFFLVVALGSVGWTATLAWSAMLERRRLRRFETESTASEADFVWVFVVPAMDEEVTIADSVSRLAAVRATHRHIIVVDDASEDATPQILAGLDVPGLHVVRRELPRARTGKAAVLDQAWEMVRTELAHIPSDRIIFGVVDADGRLDPDAPAALAHHFADPRVGGVQSAVRIYNDDHPLTWAQGIEFSVFGNVMQMGRSRWGTANMGGNGQFNRLSTLDDLASDDHMPGGVERGPWKDRLTEDQDLGVRMIQAGWRGEQSMRSVVDQQGVSNLRRLYRQRTRWAQGGWQVLDLLSSLPGSMKHVALPARADALFYLLIPVIQSLMAVGMLLALWLGAVEGVAIIPRELPVMVGLLVAGLGPVTLGVLGRGGSFKAFLRSILAFVPYLLYAFVMYPVVWRALFRQLMGRSSWAKTAREPVKDAVPQESAGPGGPSLDDGYGAAA
ncbi:glycosyltransferase family 2 protein [Paraoerskovia marina]|uniref:glycosyltransferase family 2 protein n=1 Tax=Paraoerskovia marina TaxID=545619 RepID=UPI00069356BD|nr:glycosyltransferase family 2 protein [Paraoerskovia marina]